MQSPDGGKLPSGVLTPLTHDSSEAKRQRERAAGEWATLLAARAAGAAQIGVGSLPANGAVETVTPHVTVPSTGPTESQPADTLRANTELPNRFVAELSAGDLGSITLVLEQGAGGSRVFVAGSDAAKSIISSDKFALEQSLSQAGVRVTQLSIVSRKELGTVLAEGTKRSPRGESSGQPSATQPNTGTRRRRLNLIG